MSKKHTNSLLAAGVEIGIETAGKNAEVSNLQTGEKENHSVAGDEKKKAEFEELIKGKYKKEFAERVKKIIDRRFKEVKKVNENTQMYTAEDKENLIRRLIAENQYLRKLQAEEAHNRSAESKASKLKAEAEETKKVYPDFDFKAQLENEQFVKLLKAGIGVRKAYEATNIDAILANNEKNTEKMVVDSIRSKGVRPIENGSDTTGGIVLEKNISKLTKKERKELANRAAMGETIRF